MGPLIVIVALFALTWFLLIRPQRQRQVAQANLIANLAVGDEVLTAGGFFGHIEAIGEDDLTVRIAPGTNVRVDKRAIARVIPEEDEEDGIDGEVESGAALDEGQERDSAGAIPR